jgi:protocatechuate 3,4-dioxygenase beta subunit
MRTTLALIVCGAALLSCAAAQKPVSSKEPALATLEGMVVKDPGDQPLKKAIIELIGENQEESGNYTATSDQEGHFTVTGIRVGRYHMFVERIGYLEVDEKHRQSTGTTLSFEPGQEVKDQVLRMLPAAIITGRVVDEEGDPMPDVQIWVGRRQAGGKFKLNPTGSAQTNDVGEYRIGGLFPGKYYLMATPTPNFQSLVQTQKNPADPSDPSADLSYVATFYPNATTRAGASPIELHAGDDMPVDFSLTRIHTARIRGRVEGLEPGVKAAVVLRTKDVSSMFDATETGKDGKFEIAHVAPGSYALMATTEANRPQMIQRVVEVGESNIDDLRLAPQPLATLHGRVHFPKAIRPDFSQFKVSLSSVNEDDNYPGNVVVGQDDSTGFSGPVRLKPDGSFEMKNVPPGLYEVDVLADYKPLNDSFVESIVVGMKDVTDAGLNVAGGTITIDVTVSSGAGSVDGTVANDKGEAIPNATVVAVPDSKFRKHQDRYSRVSTDQSGHFTMRGLRPGEYKLLAWEVLEDDEYLDPEFLAPFESQATVTKIEKGARQSVSLKLIAAAPDQP